MRTKGSNDRSENVGRPNNKLTNMQHSITFPITVTISIGEQQEAFDVGQLPRTELAATARELLKKKPAKKKGHIPGNKILLEENIALLAPLNEGIDIKGLSRAIGLAQSTLYKRLYTLRDAGYDIDLHRQPVFFKKEVQSGHEDNAPSQPIG